MIKKIHSDNYVTNNNTNKDDENNNKKDNPTNYHSYDSRVKVMTMIMTWNSHGGCSCSNTSSNNHTRVATYTKPLFHGLHMTTNVCTPFTPSSLISTATKRLFYR